MSARVMNREEAEAVVANIDRLLAERADAHAELARLAGPVKDVRRSAEHVYFIKGVSTGLIKIGAASNPRERLKSLQTGSPDTLQLVAVIEGGGQRLERQLQKQFLASRSHGEWFYPIPELERVMMGAASNGHH